MLITFGKHNQSSVASVVLKNPDYVRWVLRQENPERALSKVKNEMENLIAAFDSKPIMRKCSGLNCQEKATLFSTYSGSASSLFFGVTYATRINVARTKENSQHVKPTSRR